MIELTDDMRTALDNALADKAPCLVATSSADGHPGIGYRGSVMAYTSSTLAWWERTHRGGEKNILSNPHVVVLYRNPATRVAWKFFGEAIVHQGDAVREDVMAKVVQPELDRDPDGTGFAVVMEIDRVETMQGEVLMSRD
jgi:hypothetical protein